MMADKKAVPTAKVNRRGEVVCPTCGFKVPVPETHSLVEGTGMCPGGHAFLIDQECVMAFHHFLSKRGSGHSKEMLKNREETPRVAKELQERISEGGIYLP